MDNCIAPDEIEGWELEAYLHGEAGLRVVSHVARCRACAAQVAELRGLTARLDGALARVDCPSVRELLLYRWGQLPAPAGRGVEAHLPGCRACRSELAAFTGPDPGVLRQWRAEVARRLAVFVAALQSPLAAPALRGREQADPLIYAVPDGPWEIFLMPGVTSQGHTLSGQVIGATETELADALAGVVHSGPDGERLVLEAPVDPSGWFLLQPLQAGAYTVWLDLPGAHIRMPSVTVGPPAA